MLINGIELNFSGFNPDHIERYDKAKAALNEKQSEMINLDEAEASSNLTVYADALRKSCLAICDFFDGVFGDGTADQLFGAETDLEKCIDAYTQFNDGIEEISQSAMKKVKRFRAVRETKRK